MINNTDNENTIMFGPSGSNSGSPDMGGTQMFTPPGAQPDNPFAPPPAAPPPVQNGGTQLFSVPGAQQQPYQQPQSPFQQPQSPFHQPQQPFQQQPQSFQQPQSPFQQPQSPFQQQQPFQQPQPSFEQPVFGGMPPKKKNKGLMIALIALIVAVVLAGTGIIIFLLSKSKDDDEGSGKKKSSESVSDKADDKDDEDDDNSSGTNDFKPVADSLWKETNNVLNDWQKSNKSVRSAVICSDKSKCLYDGSGSADDLIADISAKVDSLDGVEYIIVIENNSCTGAAVSDTFNSRSVGTHVSGADMSGKTLDAIYSSLAVDFADTTQSSTAPTTENEKIKVPNVVGMDKEDAIAILQYNLLKYKLDGKYSDTVAENKVISQDPKSNTEVDEDTEVTITISLGKEPDANLVEVPSVVNINYTLAVDQLESRELKANVTYSDSSTIAKDYVISQSVAANTEVVKGTTVTLVVSTGPKATTAPQQPATVRGQVITEETALNVRKSPSTSADILGQVEKDSIVEITGWTTVSGKMWYMINFNNQTGYVYGDYISIMQ